MLMRKLKSKIMSILICSIMCAETIISVCATDVQANTRNVISAKEWWKTDNGKSDEGELDGKEASFSFTVKVKSGDAFIAEIHDNNNYYFTTTSFGDAWYALLPENTDSTYTKMEDTSKSIVKSAGDLIDVNFTRADGVFKVTYENRTTKEVYTMTADDKEFAKSVNVYLVAEQGEFEILSEQGKWGECVWDLDKEGVLTIHGGMAKTVLYYHAYHIPWATIKDSIKKVVFADRIYFDGEDIRLTWLFWECKNLEEVQGSEYLDTSKVTDLSALFSGCSSLKKLDINNLDTSQATTMAYMFLNCSSLPELDISNFDFSHVENLTSMFLGCNNLKKLNVDNFTNMSQLISTAYMFGECNSLTELNLYNFDLSHATFAEKMFDGTSLARVTVPANMGTITEAFISELKTAMVSGSWRDVTEGIDYEGLPDTMQAGHEYINTAVYAVDKDTGISLKNVDSSVFDENLELITGDVSTDSNFSIYAEAADKLGKENLLYNIYLQKDGEMVRPDGQVQVSIPLPEGMKEDAKVYYIAEDGTATDMNAEYMDGNLVFVTDHFSVYAVVNSSVLSGDIDGNGKVNLQDSALLRRYLAGWDVTIDENAADVDGNGKVNLQDSALLRRYLAGWDVTLK